MFWMFMDDHDRIINFAGDAWPLPKETFSHPRSNGTFAKILRSYVRERKLLTMQEALRKMTLMPAQTQSGLVTRASHSRCSISSSSGGIGKSWNSSPMPLSCWPVAPPDW